MLARPAARRGIGLAVGQAVRQRGASLARDPLELDEGDVLRLVVLEDLEVGGASTRQWDDPACPCHDVQHLRRISLRKTVGAWLGAGGEAPG